MCISPAPRLLGTWIECIQLWPEASLQWDETWILYLCRFISVGRVSDPALSMKDSWPDGMPFRICRQKWFSASSSVMFRTLFWTQTGGCFSWDFLSFQEC